MLNLKKTAVAVLALGSSAVFAGAMGPICNAINVTVPCESTAWEIGAQALYLQPSISSPATYQTSYTSGTGANYNTGVNPPYSWGFEIEGSYHFNTGNDININWYHLNTANSRSLASTGAFPLFSGIPGTALVATTASSSVSMDPQWDAVNFEFGQHVDFGEFKNIRFHGGLAYARLKNNASLSQVNEVSGTVLGTAITPATFSSAATLNPSYNGVGPRVGADMSYDWGNGLAIYANGAAALFAGTSKFSTYYADGLGVSFTSNGTKTAIVPELEAKLGATYTYAMAQGDLSIDAGWMWINYFNVGQMSVYNGGNQTDADFGLQGPFVGLKWVGNVA